MSFDKVTLMPKIMMTREIFESLPEATDGVRRRTLQKALMGTKWYAVDPQGEVGEQVEFVHPIEIGAFVRDSD